MSDVLRHLALIRQDLLDPDVSNGTIEGTYTITESNLDVIQQLAEKTLVDSMVRVDGQSRYIRDLNFGSEKTSFTVQLTLQTNNLKNAVFVETLDELIRRHPTEPPQNEYYVHSIEYLSSSSASKPPVIKQYEGFIDVVDVLREIADHDTSATYGRRRFIIFQREKLVIETVYAADDLADVPDLSSLYSDLREEAQNEQRRLIFKNTLVEALSGTPESNRFVALAQNIRDIITRFKRNYRVYVEQFSLEKLKSEFESLKLEYIQKLTTAVNEIGTKIITVPIAFILVATGFSADSPVENTIFLVGALIYSVVISLFVCNQQDALRRLDAEIEGAVDRLQSSAPDSVEAMESEFDDLTQHQRSQRNRLFLMQALIWIVFAFTFGLFVYKSFPDCLF